MGSVDPIVDLLKGRRLFVLVGAGCSTESGIPDYRSSGIKRPPLEHRAFVTDPVVRRRYWSRSFVGWPRIANARPNPAHHALTALQRAQRTAGIVTQNVDGLHQAAGTVDPIELHGALRDVICLGCGAVSARAALQGRIAALNPAWAEAHAAGAAGADEGATRPDGDAAIGTLSAPDRAEPFVVPACERCGGVLKPAVTMFGDNVPRAIVDRCYARLDEAEAVLVIGSSLTVFSGYRFVVRGAERGLPVAIVNRGPTRADRLAGATLDATLGAALPEIAAALGA